MRQLIPYLICLSFFWISCKHKKEEKVLPPLEITPEKFFSYVGKGISEIQEDCKNREGYTVTRPFRPSSITVVKVRAVGTNTPGRDYKLSITVDDSTNKVIDLLALCQDTLNMADVNRQILYYYDHGFKNMSDLIEQEAMFTAHNTVIPLNEWLQKLNGLNCPAPVLHFRNDKMDVSAICKPLVVGADRYTYDFSIHNFGN